MQYFFIALGIEILYVSILILADMEENENKH
jgi:hypothetical protein